MYCNGCLVCVGAERGEGNLPNSTTASSLQHVNNCNHLVMGAATTCRAPLVWLQVVGSPGQWRRQCSHIIWIWMDDGRCLRQADEESAATCLLMDRGHSRRVALLCARDVERVEGGRQRDLYPIVVIITIIMIVVGMDLSTSTTTVANQFGWLLQGA